MQGTGTRKAGRREWLGLAALTVMVFMLATDMTMLFMAMPWIAADLTPGSTQMLWILHVDQFLAAGLVITLARFGDRIGRRRILVIGAGAYAVASTVAALSTSPEMLIAARALLGIAAATVMPSTMSLLRNMFPDSRQFSLAMAINLSAFSVGAALGPPMAGFLMEYFWWGSVFLANVPPALMLLLAGPLLLPEYRDPDAGRLDFRSVGLSLAGVIAIIYGLQELAAQGLSAPYLGAVAVGTVLIIIFVRRQQTLDDPLLDLSLFRIPAFSISLLALGLILIVGAADLIFVQHLQVGLGLSTSQAGLLLIIPALASAVGTMLAPIVARQIRPAYVMSAGLVVAAAGAMIIATYAGTGGAAVLIAGATLIGIGAGPTITLVSEIIVSRAPLQRAGSASAVQDVGAGLGFALGLSIVGSMSMILYRRSLEGSIPTSISADESVAAQESVGGAIGVAEGLSGSAANEMLHAAREAFAVGVQGVFAMSVVILLAVATLLVWHLRDVPTSTESEEEAAEAVADDPLVQPQMD